MCSQRARGLERWGRPLAEWSVLDPNEPASRSPAGRPDDGGHGTIVNGEEKTCIQGKRCARSWCGRNRLQVRADGQHKNVYPGALAYLEGDFGGNERGTAVAIPATIVAPLGCLRRKFSNYHCTTWLSSSHVQIRCSLRKLEQFIASLGSGNRDRQLLSSNTAMVRVGGPAIFRDAIRCKGHA